MIIDFHTHIFPPDVATNRDDYLRRDETFAEMYANPRAEVAGAEALLQSMDEIGIQTSVALGFGWADQADIVRHNDYLLEAGSHSAGRILPFCTVNMASPDAPKEIERCAAARARGLGELRPDSQGWALDGEAGETLAELARKFGLMLLFHVTEPGYRDYPGRRGCEFESFRAYVARHSDLMIIGAHFGGGFYTGSGDPAEPYVDTAAQPFLHPGDRARAAIIGIPPDRLLFGSDFPLISQGRQLAELRTALPESHDLSAALGGNAEALLRAVRSTR